MTQSEWEAASRPRRKAVAATEARPAPPPAWGNGPKPPSEPPVGPGTGGEGDYPSEEAIEEIRKTYPNAYKPWTDEEEARLRQLVREGKSIPEMTEALGRQPGAIRSRLRRMGLMSPA